MQNVKYYSLNCIARANLDVERIEVELVGDVRVILLRLQAVLGEDTTLESTVVVDQSSDAIGLANETIRSNSPISSNEP